jgi:hypothetical protein
MMRYHPAPRIPKRASVVFGAANLILIGLDMRDGLRLTGRIGRGRAAPQAA